MIGTHKKDTVQGGDGADDFYSPAATTRSAAAAATTLSTLEGAEDVER